MITLRERLTDESLKGRCIEACSGLVEREVAARKGLGGTALKTVLGLLKKVRPTLVPEAMTRLIPHFAEALQPWWERAAQDPQRFSDALQSEPSAVANALLQVTDARIEGASEGVRKGYAKLRKGAAKQVEQSVPGIAQTLGDLLR